MTGRALAFGLFLGVAAATTAQAQQPFEAMRRPQARQPTVPLDRAFRTVPNLRPQPVDPTDPISMNDSGLIRATADLVVELRQIARQQSELLQQQSAALTQMSARIAAQEQQLTSLQSEVHDSALRLGAVCALVVDNQERRGLSDQVLHYPRTACHQPYWEQPRFSYIRNFFLSPFSAAVLDVQEGDTLATQQGPGLATPAEPPR